MAMPPTRPGMCVRRWLGGRRSTSPQRPGQPETAQRQLGRERSPYKGIGNHPFFPVLEAGAGGRRGHLVFSRLKSAHDKQGVNSYASGPAEAVSGREYHVPPRVTLVRHCQVVRRRSGCRLGRLMVREEGQGWRECGHSKRQDSNTMHTQHKSVQTKQYLTG